MKFNASRFVWLDGKFTTIERANVPITTHAIHYGTSIFEGIRAYWNSENLNIFRLQDHIRRFRQSGSYYMISLNFTEKQIFDAIVNLCKKNKMKKSCYIRPFYFVSQYGINLHVTEKSPTCSRLEIFSTKMASRRASRLGENLMTLPHLLWQRWGATT